MLQLRSFTGDLIRDNATAAVRRGAKLTSPIIATSFFPVFPCVKLGFVLDPPHYVVVFCHLNCLTVLISTIIDPHKHLIAITRDNLYTKLR